MTNLGVSIYPAISNLSEDKEYLKKAAELGYNILFTSLLEVSEDNLDLLDKYKETLRYAQSLGFRVAADVNPNILKLIGKSLSDYEFYAEYGINVIRMDLNYSGKEEARLSNNDQGLFVELNASSNLSILDSTLYFGGDLENILACHNFYPQKYSGLSVEHYTKTSKYFKKENIELSTFVTSQVGNQGPWENQNGLPTLELHRDWSIESQTAYLKLLGLTDNIIIGNAYATDEELRAVSEVIKNSVIPIPAVKVNGDENDSLTDEIVVSVHSIRSDYSPYIYRSSIHRTSDADKMIKFNGEFDVKEKDILICTEGLAQYNGEVQVALKDMETNYRNKVGEVTDEGMELLNLLGSHQPFAFKWI